MQPTEQAALLAKIPLFAGLPRAEITHLAETLQPRGFAPGELLLKEGDADQRFFILMEGQVEVIKALGTADEHKVAVRASGTIFGEMSLFDPRGQRTASVRALTKVLTLEMTVQDFDRLLQRYPLLAYDVVRQMSRRLEDTENATILDLREKNQQLTLAYQELKAAQEQLVIKERLEKELAIARQIQESILPKNLPHLEGFDIAALTIPAREVGGDYYDFIPLGDERFGLVVGDAADKGIPAALFITLTNSLVHVEAKRNPTPDATLKLVNQHLLEMSRSGMFVTLLYGILDHSGRFDYCRAGHPHPIILDEKQQLVDTGSNPGMALGILADLVLDSHTITIHPGGMVVIFSDGLSEAMDAADVQFGAERIAKELTAFGDLTATGICAQLWKKVQEFVGEKPQSDDFTLIVIKRLGM